MVRARSPAQVARRAHAWAVAFTTLAALHLVVLPQVLEERLDRLVAVAAGVIYLGLAAWNWHSATAAAAVAKPDGRAVDVRLDEQPER